MFHTTTALITGCNDPNCERHGQVDTRIELELQYTDQKHDIELAESVKSPPKNTIQNITKELLVFLCLDDISPEDVRLAGYTPRNGRYCTLNIKNTQTTIRQLDVTDGCILHFEPTPTAPPPKPCQLIIVGPDEVKKVNYEWYREKTTVGMLLKYVIETFSLQSVERERIHLITITEELEFFAFPDERLSRFHLHSGMFVHVQIIPPLSPTTVNKNKDVHVQCTCDTDRFNFDVPNTETIGELKTKIEKRFENRQIVDFELYNEMDDEFDSNDSARDLKSFGVKSGQKIFVTFRLINRTTQSTLANNKNDSSTKSSLSSITKQNYGKITVVCKFPSKNSESFQIPLTSIVSQVITKVQDLTPNQRLVISKMSPNDDKTDFKKETTRCLADLGLTKDDILNVTLTDKSRTNASIVSSQSPSSPEADKKSKTQRTTKMPIGLDNLGNSCYMNSALQCLAHIPQLTNMFLDSIDRAHMEDGEHTDADWNPYDQVGDVSGAYAELLWYLWRYEENGNDYDSFKPNRIKERIGNKDSRFATDDQQDAQEFMTFFLNIIHEELKVKNKNQRNTIIKQFFYGEIMSTITCTACNKEESSKQPISFLSIPLNRQERKFWINFISKKGKDALYDVDVPINGRVENVVDEFTTSYNRPSLFYYILAMLPDGELDFKTPLNEIPTDEFVFMEQEDQLRQNRPTRLKLPQKRSTLEDCLAEFFSREVLEDGWTCPQEKCKKKTTATKQLKLCIPPTVLIIQFKRFSHENGFHQKIDTLVQYPIEGLDLNKCLPLLQEEAIYDLVAVSNHMGSISGGHYTAYARHKQSNNNEWYRFDDSCVTLVKPEDYKYDIVSRHAYLLFYIKRDLSNQVTQV